MEYFELTSSCAELAAYKAGLEAAAVICNHLQRVAPTVEARNMAAIAAAKIRGCADVAAASERVG